jgi:hypothetical protein
MGKNSGKKHWNQAKTVQLNYYYITLADMLGYVCCSTEDFYRAKNNIIICIPNLRCDTFE